MARKGHTFATKDYGTWDVYHKAYSRSELLGRRRQLAKAANSRLLRLERAKSDITGKSLVEQSQFEYITDFYLAETRGRRRFSESLNQRDMSDMDVKNEITMLENFLSMKTSTVTGARGVERKRVETFVNKGVPREIAKSKAFYDFLNSSTFDELTYGAIDSGDLIELIEEYAPKIPLDRILSEFEKHTEKQRSGYKGLVESLNANVIDYNRR